MNILRWGVPNRANSGTRSPIESVASWRSISFLLCYFFYTHLIQPGYGYRCQN